jgi:hypothetical protein
LNQGKLRIHKAGKTFLPEAAQKYYFSIKNPLPEMDNAEGTYFRTTISAAGRWLPIPALPESSCSLRGTASLFQEADEKRECTFDGWAPGWQAGQQSGQ